MSVEQAMKVVAQLEAKREACVRAGTELHDERANVPLSAHTGDAKARKRLDEINTAVATHASELASLDAALRAAADKLGREPINLQGVPACQSPLCLDSDQIPQRSECRDGPSATSALKIAMGHNTRGLRPLCGRSLSSVYRKNLTSRGFHTSACPVDRLA
jgi:hypothetical protein